MKLYKNIAVILFAFWALLIITLGGIYNYMISPVSRNDNLRVVDIKFGSSVAQIGKILKDNNLIRDEFVFKLYLRIHNIDKLQAGRYNFSENMNLKTIVRKINEGMGLDLESFNITFPEGKNMRQIALIIERNTNNEVKDIFNLLKDEKYINSLIDKYWFLTDEIKNKDIYYALEGYLAPNTYNIRNKDVKVEEIFEIMLDQTDKVLSKYKDDISKLNFTVHEFLTLASIVESEGVNNKDRPKIAGVFYNRLDRGEKLDSCVTTYYALRLEIGDNPNLTYEQMAFISPYNTYLAKLAGKLPIGPISNPGEASISATVNPVKHNYLFFLSDKFKNTYFSATNAEHEAKIQELIDKGAWNRW